MPKDAENHSLIRIPESVHSDFFFLALDLFFIEQHNWERSRAFWEIW